MFCRIVTLKYDESLGGFPEKALHAVSSCGNLLDIREYFFQHGGVPCMTFVMLFDAISADTDTPRNRRSAPDPGEGLPEELRPLYSIIRQWRNARAKQDGIPAYAVFRNAQLAEICLRRPGTVAELKEIEGVGEATCRKYAQDVLALLAEKTAQSDGGIKG